MGLKVSQMGQKLPKMETNSNKMRPTSNPNFTKKSESNWYQKVTQIGQTSYQNGIKKLPKIKYK